MNISIFLTVFPRQLRFWAFHGVLNALPCLWIAWGPSGFWKDGPSVVAMLSAIVTFFLFLATLTSLHGSLFTEGHLLSRALKLGVRIRTGMALISLIPLAITKNGPEFILDSYCGIAALIASCYMILPGFSINDLAYGPPTGQYLIIFATTILTGLMLSFFVLMTSFFALIILQARDWKKLFASADSR
jgi:hypothetical protein